MSDLEWKKLREEEQKVGFRVIMTKYFQMPDGTEHDYQIWGKPDLSAAAVVAISKDGKVVVARQFRPGPERIMDELPGGYIEEGEDASVAALRELKEETGYTKDKPLIPLGFICRDSYMNQTNNYFLATDCYKESGQELDEHEFVDIVTITLDELHANARNGKMTDSAGALMALEELKEMQHGK